MSVHRLLPSIVFASTSLLASACGGQIDGSVSLPPAPDPAPLPTTDAAPNDAPTVDAIADPRACEKGWPTTKGQMCTFDAGVTCCTGSWGEDAAAPTCCRTEGQ